MSAKPKNFKRGWLIGIDQISQHTGYQVPDIMSWITHWVDCPIEKIESAAIWVVQKRDIERFVREKKPPKSVGIPKATLTKTPKQRRRKPKW
jgi:hypothetical protein